MSGVAVEQYSDFGTLKNFLPVDRQSQQLFGVVDYKSEAINVEAGVGYGLTGASDRMVVKVMVSRDFYTPPHKSSIDPPAAATVLMRDNSLSARYLEYRASMRRTSRVASAEALCANVSVGANSWKTQSQPSAKNSYLK